MSEDKLCVQFLRAAAARVRLYGLARGTRIVTATWRVSDTPPTAGAYGPSIGSVCMLGAMDHCGVSILYKERLRIEQHLLSILPQPPSAGEQDKWNGIAFPDSSPSNRIAWWSNMKASDAEEVAKMFLKAAETC